MRPRVRNATPADAEALAPLFAQLGYPTETSEIRIRLTNLKPDTAVLLACGENDEAVGAAIVGIREDVITETSATLLALVVLDGKRSRGVGAQLLGGAERWAIERGSTSLVVRSNVVRESAHRFYERHGYGRVKTQHVLRKRLEPLAASMDAARLERM